MTVHARSREMNHVRGYSNRRVQEEPRIFTREVDKHIRGTFSPVVVSVGVDSMICCSSLFLSWMQDQPPFTFVRYVN